MTIGIKQIASTFSAAISIKFKLSKKLTKYILIQVTYCFLCSEKFHSVYFGIESYHKHYFFFYCHFLGLLYSGNFLKPKITNSLIKFCNIYFEFKMTAHTGIVSR